MATIPVPSMNVSASKKSNVEAPLPKTFPNVRPMSPSEDVVVCGVIGPTNIDDMPACPCCNRRVSNAEGRQTLDEPASTSRSSRRDIPCAFNFDEEHEEDDDTDDEEEDDDYLPGTLDSGVEYKFKRVLAEGWVHKKGTGNDWLRSRGWKTRWAQLVLAKVEGVAVDVPLLIISWYPGSPHPSTAIMLDSTVVVPVDKKENGKLTCNSFQFDVIHVHVKDGESSSEGVTRTFSVPQKGRNEWVYAMNSALLKYEKDNAQARREAAALIGLRPRSTSYGKSILEGERYRTLSDSANSRPLSPPPLSPRSPPSAKRPVPRPDTHRLLGESLLD